MCLSISSPSAERDYRRELEGRTKEAVSLSGRKEGRKGERTARFFDGGHALPHGIFNYSLYSRAREENNADQRRMARERTALCLPRTSNCFGWGESAITVERRSRISSRRCARVYVKVCVRARACTYVHACEFARPIYVVAETNSRAIIIESSRRCRRARFSPEFRQNRRLLLNSLARDVARERGAIPRANGSRR